MQARRLLVAMARGWVVSLIHQAHSIVLPHQH
jgi:hypothetical protein